MFIPIVDLEESRGTSQCSWLSNLKMNSSKNRVDSSWKRSGLHLLNLPLRSQIKKLKK